jgi:pyrimidine operon attenuation protein / uracil phosphoribosyltransferase
MRLAYEIVERNRGGENITMFGIRRRGVGLARSLGDAVGDIEGRAPELHALDVTAFRDDLAENPPVLSIDPPPTVEGRNVVIVDDVLFTGRTVRAGIDAVLYYGRPATIQLAVLIDRGHREYPIRPDYVGRTIPTKHGERIVVEIEPELQVFLEE